MFIFRIHEYNCFACNKRCRRRDIGIAFLAVATPFAMSSFCDSLCFSHWSWRVLVCQACVTWLWTYVHGLLSLLNLCQVFVIRSVSPLPYNLGSPYLVHTLSMVCTYQPGTWHLTLNSFSRSTDFVRIKSSFGDQVVFSIAIEPRVTIFGQHIDYRKFMSAGNVSLDEGQGCPCLWICHLNSLISVSWHDRPWEVCGPIVLFKTCRMLFVLEQSRVNNFSVGPNWVQLVQLT